MLPIKTYIVRIAAGARKTVRVRGSFLLIDDNSIATNPLVAIGDSGGDGGELAPGQAVTIGEGEGFEKIQFYNPAGTPMVLKIKTSSEEIADNRAIFTGVVTVKDVSSTIISPAALPLNVGNGYQNTYAGNINRKKLIIQNQGINPFWWGASYATIDPATNRGQKVNPGGCDTIDNTADVFFESNTQDAIISLTEFTI